MRRVRSLLDLALAGLALWAAWYHTPAGALVRVVSAHVFGTRTTARPLLAYYSAGTEGAQAPEVIVPRPPLAPAAALGAGASAAMSRLAPAERERILARNHLRSAAPEGLSDVVAHLSSVHGSREGGVLAFFCGGEAARFAVERAGRGARLEDLARELPPSYERSISLAGETLTLGTAYALAWPVPPGPTSPRHSGCATIRCSAGSGSMRASISAYPSAPRSMRSHRESYAAPRTIR